MKKSILFVAAAGVSLVLFSSCATDSVASKYVFDDSVPAEQSAVLEIHAGGGITGYNGVAVEWKATSDFYLAYIITIPAGETLLEFDIVAYGFGARGKTITYKGKGLLFYYNFLPNKKYLLRFGRNEEEIWGMNVYTYESTEKIQTNNKALDAHFPEFVPFLNAQGTGNIVLE